MKIRYLIEKSCEHGYFGKHITDYDPAGNTFCLTKPVVLEADEELVERIAAHIFSVLAPNVPFSEAKPENRSTCRQEARSILAALIPADENR